MVESTAWVFPDPPRSRGVYHICLGFVKFGILPIYDKPCDKSHIIIIRDIFHHSTVVYRGPYSTKPSDKLRPILFVTSGCDLSYVAGFVIYGWGLSYMGGICQIWAPIYYGTVMKYVANNFGMVFFWSLSVLSIWAGHLPIFDKSK